MRLRQQTILLPLVLGLTGCATFEIDQSLRNASERVSIVLESQPTLVVTDEQKAQLFERSTVLLQEPLTMVNAVRLMLVNSPEFQSVLARYWAIGAAAGQSGRIPNPLLNFERVTVGSELELGRLISFGLLDLIQFPWRQQSASLQIKRVELELASEILGKANLVQEAWINAVVAKQKEEYAKRVLEVTEADAELARRLHEAGNFTLSQRIRRQLFYSDAVVSYALAKQKSVSMLERLIRLLGLTREQQLKLSIPNRLPQLPDAPWTPSEVSSRATHRLDIDMAKMDYDAALKRAGVDTVGSFIDIEVGIRRNTTRDRETGDVSRPRGYELDVRLPLFDWGGLQRDRLSADLLLKANLLEATVRNAESSVRESYITYRTSFDVAKHYRDEVIPMRETLAEESVYQYNGMLIGTFELLAESRSQVQAIEVGIDAHANFLRAQLALESTLLGKPNLLGVELSPASQGREASGAH